MTITTIASMQAARPYWMTRPCPPWCWGGHADEEQPGDRACMSEVEHRITLTTEDADVLVVNGKFVTEPVVVGASLVQEYREAEPRVVLSRGETAELHFTLGEARKLAAAIADLVITA